MIRVAGRPYEVDWGHLFVATLIVGVCLWYLADARSTSLNTQNLLMVQPAAVLAVILYLFILPQCIRRLPEAPDRAPPTASGTAGLLRISALAAAFGFFTFSLETIGFDVATWIFVTAGLFICGERRPLTLAIFPLVFAIAVVLGYQQLLPYPIHTLIL